LKLLPRIQAGNALPKSWLWIGIIEYPAILPEATRRQCYEAILLVIRLPSFGYHYVIDKDREVWCQLVLRWHGWYGFRMEWVEDTRLHGVGING
jgi:hypothetical protein